MRPILSAQKIKKSYDTPAGIVDVLHGVDLQLMPGEIGAIMGPSGCGKSTLLCILGLLQPASSGSYKIMGQDVLKFSARRSAAFRRNNLGFVLQSCNLFENSTVYENLEFPLIYRKVATKERPEIIKNALDQVKLLHRLDHPTNRLSGGEQQRVAIARALVNKPAVILGDEPTGQLDSHTGKKVMECFREIISDDSRAVILVTHDVNIAKRCDRTFVLTKGLLKEK